MPSPQHAGQQPMTSTSMVFYLQMTSFPETCITTFKSYSHDIDSSRALSSEVLWLILHINLPGLRDAQIAGKTLFAVVSLRVFPTPL